jgi:hypothetical protein
MIGIDAERRRRARAPSLPCPQFRVAGAFRPTFRIAMIASRADFRAADPRIESVVCPLNLGIFHSEKSPLIWNSFQRRRRINLHVARFAFAFDSVSFRRQ